MCTDVQLRLLRGDPDEMAELQRVFEVTPDYFERVAGGPPGKADAQSQYTILPEGMAYNDEFVFGIFVHGALVGCADVLRGYPSAETATIGLLLLHQRSGHVSRFRKDARVMSVAGASPTTSKATAGHNDLALLESAWLAR